MFKKVCLAKFEWSGLPEPLNDIFVENLLLNSSDYNFSVVNLPREMGGGEFWSLYNVLERSDPYGIPERIQVVTHKGSAFATSNFVLFNNFKNQTTLNAKYISYYSTLIAQVNRALNQHITASELVATIYASSDAEKKEIEKTFERFDGVKVVKLKADPLSESKQSDFVQFNITPRMDELETLKHDLEKDLFLRLGINYGTDKTHVTTLNIKDSEEPLALINAYELKLREDFCKRYNAWKKSETLSVRIHAIDEKNTITNNKNNPNKEEQNANENE